MTAELLTTENKLKKLLNEQRKIGQFCDVAIKLNNGFKMDAHFCIIAPQSDFVGNKYFQQETMQFSIHNPLKIEICNFDCEECLSDVLDFMYSNDITIFSQHIDHLKQLCKILCISNLLTFITQDELLHKHTNNSTHTSNAVELLSDKRQQSEPVSPQKPEQLHKQLSSGTETIKDDIILKVETKITRKSAKFKYKIQNEPSQTKMHTCPGCHHKCYRPIEMLQHLLICPTNNTKCPLCDKHFDTLTEFRDHLKRHDNAKPFYCNDCNLRFATKGALYLHTPKHSLVTPHICTYCNRGFKWKHGLNSHLIVHSKEKKLLCDECGYSTSHLKTLRTHQLSHTGFVYRCTAATTTGCTYTSRRKENLKIHIATHKNETPFVCEICGYRFSQNKNLKRHALLHISKNLHKCPHCSFSNYRTDKLKEHILRLHTEKPLQLELTEHIQDSFELKDCTVNGDGVIDVHTEKPTGKKRKRTGTGATSSSATIGGVIRTKRKYVRKNKNFNNKNQLFTDTDFTTTQQPSSSTNWTTENLLNIE